MTATLDRARTFARTVPAALRGGAGSRGNSDQANPNEFRPPAIVHAVLVDDAGVHPALVPALSVTGDSGV